MPVKCEKLITWLEEWAPKFLAQEGDRTGLLIGSRSGVIEKVLVALEVTEEVVNEAVDVGVQLIVSHHPLFRDPLSSLPFDTFPTSLIARLVQAGIHLYVAHTNLDAAPGGVSDVLARRLGLAELELLLPTRIEKLYKVVVFVPQGYEDAVREAMCSRGAGWIGNYSECTFQTEGTGTFRPLPGSDPFLGRVGELEKAREFRLETIVPEEKLPRVLEAMLQAHPYEEVAYDVYPLWNQGRCYGFGRVGKLPEPIPLDRFAGEVKRLLGLKVVRVIGDPGRIVKKVALCGGSGMSLLARALKAGADVYLTGDVRHHEALEAKAHGIAVVDAGHHGTEWVVVPVLAGYLREKAEKEKVELEVLVSRVNTDPFLYF